MRKRTIIVSAIPLAVAGIVGASAFIAATSTGTGHAAQGTEAPHITTTVAVPTVNFGQSGTVTVSVHNDSTKLSVKLTSLAAGTLTVTPTGTNTCPAGSFTVTGVSPALPLVLSPGQTGVAGTATLNFVDLPGASNEQTGCLGADVAITATVS